CPSTCRTTGRRTTVATAR
ncbi:fatty acid desaturase 4 chloroplastic, partial [Phtheirospermum japonicum]